MLVEFYLPVKNEQEILETNIKYLLKFLKSKELSYSWQVVIIVNGSQDASDAIAQKLVHDYLRVKAKYLNLSGKGRALRTYFHESSADILVFMDIDLAVDLNNISELLNPLLNQQAQLVIGSRLLPASHLERSFLRSFTSRVYNILSRLILRHNFSDLQCGFKAIKKETFEVLRPWFKDDNWFFDTELVILTMRRGYHIKEIPVDWQETRYQKRQSKVRLLRDGWSFIKNLFSFCWRLSRINFNS